MRRLALALAALLAGTVHGPGAMALEPGAGTIRLATFNAHLARGSEGALVAEFGVGSAQIDAVAEIVQRLRPDILLINEIDHDADGVAARLFQASLREGRGDAAGIDYPHVFTAPVNTGIPTGLDLDGDGRSYGPGDAQGWGVFEGQFGMALYSRFPVDRPAIRTFAETLWSEMPDNRAPWDFYPDGAAETLRLSSKSHWAVPVALPDGRRLTVLAAHPTPPVFDGPEDRNGRRNADEIRLLSDIIDDAPWLRDDLAGAGGPGADAAFVVLGDLNADPSDGDGNRDAIAALLGHPRLQDPGPMSAGALEAAMEQGGVNTRQNGDPALDTADWRDADDFASGNLRVDYVLPSRELEVTGSGVFWPAANDPLRRLVGDGETEASSDHRLVWVDIKSAP